MRVMGHWWNRIDERRMVAIILVDDGEGCETEVEIPIEFDVCDTCEGKGTHVNPSIDAHGITEDEWGQWDSDEQEFYMSGGYDVECHECAGKRVIPVPAETRMTDEQKTALEYATDCQYERLADHRTYLMESGIPD
jgi:RecJ-like exonuclease